MQITKHGLKKPKDDTFYDIEDFNYNTDILEEHLDNDQLHVNATEISQITEATTLSQIDETDTNFTMWGKVKKAIATLVSHITIVATGSTLGHIKIGTGIQMNGGTASVKLTDSVSVADSTTALSAKAGKSINDSKAPINHASTATTYGIGNGSNYGHIKLSDNYTSSAGAAAVGMGASSQALYNAYTILNNGKSSTSHGHSGVWNGNYHVGLSADGLNFRPYLNAGPGSAAADNTINMGSGSYRWKQFYAGTGTISTSDRNYKENISSLTEKHIKFFNMLVPVSYTFKEGDSGRTHIGFIAQDVEEAMKALGMTSMDFAGFCKDKKVTTEVDDSGNILEKPILDNNGDIQYIYSLRYDEFIALTAGVLQDSLNRIERIEKLLELKVRK